MAGKKGMAATARLRERSKEKRGGMARQHEAWNREDLESLACWQEAYLESLAVKHYSAGTIEGRREGLRVLGVWCEERDLKKAREITRPVLESFQRWLWRYRTKQDQPLGISTQRNRLGAVKHYFAWLVRQGVLDGNPASELELPRADKRLPAEALSPEQMTAIMRVPDVRDALGIRDRAILETFYSTGLRRAELAHLAVSDINTTQHTLRVRSGKGRKDRVVPVGEQARDWLRRYLEEVRPLLLVDGREQTLFLTSYGGPFHPDVLSRQVTATFKAAGITRAGSCHLFRHTCATHMLENGADVRFIQQLLGHESLDTTAIYTEVNIRQLREVHARTHPSAKVEEVVTMEKPLMEQMVLSLAAESC